MSNPWLFGVILLTSVPTSLAGAQHDVEFLYPAKDVDPKTLESDERVTVTQTDAFWNFAPDKDQHAPALLFFPGGGVEPIAYAPLLRAVAAEGFAVYLVKLPGKPALPDKHKRDSIDLGTSIMAEQSQVKHWVVGGHSMGAAIAAQFVHEQPNQFAGLILIATTHPRDFDVSSYAGDVAKIYGTQDNVAKFDKSEANKHLLPKATTWVRIEGGNHAQFGNYGTQFGDGQAAISRDVQQSQTLKAILESLQRISQQVETK